MNEENDIPVRKLLEEWGLLDAKRLIAQYHCRRSGENGANGDVVVQIFDWGPERNSHRYQWEVSELRDGTNRNAASPPSESVLGAGCRVRWGDLDKF